MISFIGGGMQTFDETVPLIASFLLMTVSWIVFQTQKPQTTTLEVGSPASRLHVAKGRSH